MSARPRGGDHDSPLAQPAFAGRAFPCISERYISLVIQGFRLRYTPKRIVQAAHLIGVLPAHRVNPVLPTHIITFAFGLIIGDLISNGFRLRFTFSIIPYNRRRSGTTHGFVGICFPIPTVREICQETTSSPSKDCVS